MAKRRAGRRRLLVLLVVVAYTGLAIAGILPNPLPAVWGWVASHRSLPDGLAWQDRLGARPAAAAVVGDAVVVVGGGSAQLRERDSGEPLVPGGSEWTADWLVVTGTAANASVITRPEGGDGYQVRGGRTGELRHVDDEAVAVWGFRDSWIDLRCDRSRACRLRGYRPGRVEPSWRTDLPGQRSGMLGADPELAAPARPAAPRIEPAVAGGGPVPPVLGFTATRGGDDVVVVVDTATGRVLRELTPGPDERVLVAGGRVVRSVMTTQQDVCVSRVSGHDPVTGDPVWGPVSYHLWGTGGVGCEQRERPLGNGGALHAVAPDGRPVVLDAYDGRVLWSGELGERVVGLSPELAVVRAADPETTVYGVRLGGDGEPLWDRRTSTDAGVVVAECGVVVADRDPSRLYVWDPATGENLVSVPAAARVLACAPDGLVVAAGRSVGFARFDAATDSPGGAPAARAGGDDGAAGRSGRAASG